MSDRPLTSYSEFSLNPWDTGGIATFEAAGSDRRTAMEAALRAILALAGAGSTAPTTGNAVRSAPIRGEGDDLALLFADLAEDLLSQLDDFAAGLYDVTLDGIVRRDDGGFVAWGYAHGIPRATPALPRLRLHGAPTINEDQPGKVVIHAALARDGAA